MVAVGISSIIMFGLHSLIKGSIEDVSYYKKKEESSLAHRQFARKWSQIIQSTGLALVFQKIPISLDRDCTDLVAGIVDGVTTSTGNGGPCVFSVQNKSRDYVNNGHLAPVIYPLEENIRSEMVAQKPSELTSSSSYINFFKNEWLETVSEELRIFEKPLNKQQPAHVRTHKKAYEPTVSDNTDRRHFIGWWLTEQYPLGLLLKENRMPPFTLTLLGNLAAKGLDPGLINNNETGNRYLFASSRPLAAKDLRGQLMVFYDSEDPRIYTLMQISADRGDEIFDCSSDNGEKCINELNSYQHENKKVSDSGEEYKKKIDNKFESRLYYIIPLKTVDPEQEAWSSMLNPPPNTPAYPAIDHSIQWISGNDDNGIYHFPHRGFSLDLDGFSQEDNKSDFFSNPEINQKYSSHLYKVRHYLKKKSQTSSSGSEILGRPVRWVVIKKESLTTSASNNNSSTEPRRSKITLTRYVFNGKDYERRTKTLLTNMIHNRSCYNPDHRKREDLIVARQIGTSAISAFIIDAEKQTDTATLTYDPTRGCGS